MILPKRTETEPSKLPDPGSQRPDSHRRHYSAPWPSQVTVLQCHPRSHWASRALLLPSQFLGGSSPLALPCSSAWSPPSSAGITGISFLFIYHISVTIPVLGQTHNTNGGSIPKQGSMKPSPLLLMFTSLHPSAFLMNQDVQGHSLNEPRRQTPGAQGAPSLEPSSECCELQPRPSPLR